MSLVKDVTHDVEVCLDNDAGLLRLLITVSDTRLADKSTSSQQRASDQRSALNKYTVRLSCYISGGMDPAMGRPGAPH